MSQTDLVTGHESLLAAAKAFFDDYYENPHIKTGTIIDSEAWLVAVAALHSE